MRAVETSPLLCLSCFHRWIGRYPAGKPLLFECPKCGEHEGVRDEEDDE